MGSSQSVLTPEAAVALAVVASAIGIGYKQLGQTSQDSTTTQAPSSSGKKGKKKQKQEKTQSAVYQPPPAPETPPVPVAKIVPGGFELDKTSSALPEGEDAASSPPSMAAKGKNKKKKKKAKAAASATTPSSSSLPARVGVESGPSYDSESSIPPKKVPPAQPSRPLYPSVSIDTDGSWTRVESGRRKRGVAADPPVDVTTTDPGIFTGSSSPVTERTEDDTALRTFYPSVDDSSVDDDIPLTERLLPKPVKTAVDDMLETPDHPTLARVMRVQPRPNEKPASGFSWGDYEDVQATESTGGGNDADGEDEGWGVVRRKRSRPDRMPLSSSQLPETQSQGQKPAETLTKRQRQNARKRDEQKAEKADAEAERLAALAKHKKALEKERIAEQFKRAGSGKAPSGGMKATVDDHGKLVWE